MSIFKRNISLALIFDVVFIITFLLYFNESTYPGPFLLGMISGITAVAELFTLIITVKNFKLFDTCLKAYMALFLSLISLVISGYVFITWLFFKFTGVL